MKYKKSTYSLAKELGDRSTVNLSFCTVWFLHAVLIAMVKVTFGYYWKTEEVYNFTYRETVKDLIKNLINFLVFDDTLAENPGRPRTKERFESIQKQVRAVLDVPLLDNPRISPFCFAIQRILSPTSKFEEFDLLVSNTAVHKAMIVELIGSLLVSEESNPRLYAAQYALLSAINMQGGNTHFEYDAYLPFGYFDWHIDEPSALPASEENDGLKEDGGLEDAYKATLDAIWTPERLVAICNGAAALLQGLQQLLVVEAKRNGVELEAEVVHVQEQPSNPGQSQQAEPARAETQTEQQAQPEPATAAVS